MKSAVELDVKNTKVIDINDERHQKNKYVDSKEAEGWKLKAEKMVPQLIDLALSSQFRSGSIYLGLTGVGLTLLMLSEWKVSSKKENDFKLAIKYCDEALDHISSRRLTFLEGKSGAYATLAVLYARLGMESSKKKMIKECLRLKSIVKKLKGDQCEILYGKCGYLYSLLFLRKMLNDEKIGGTESRKVVKSVVKDGIKQSQFGFDLFYTWKGSPYLGAAHGLCGIYYILLHFADLMKELKAYDKLQNSINTLLNIRFVSQNMPSSLGRDRDRLVHWCHGATGFVSLCLKAHSVYEDPKYLLLAETFGLVVWKRGLLHLKSVGLCHGVSGNGMTFLSLYRATKKEVWFCRATHFATFAMENLKELSCFSDDKHSLYTGTQGLLLFLGSILKAKDSWWVGWEI
mmetsp:Transcript_9595/g.14379  ORF Transcript_9595/g.14379 Transcript_9595/m.14379 type:complete len:402 (+) Transcript_9595:35-1240(+)